MTYEDNHIGKDDHDELAADILKTYKKSDGWLPVKTYDLVQCGYPLPNHGEMILRDFGGTNAAGELLPPKGMWVKAEDIRKMLNEKVG